MERVKTEILIFLICILTFTSTSALARSKWHSDTPYIHVPNMQQYIGDWSYHDDSITIILKLRLYPKVYSPIEKRFVDYMFGWYSFEKNINGIAIKEETLSYFNPSENPAKILFEKMNDLAYKIDSFPPIDAYSRNDSSLHLNIKRIPMKPGPALNIIGILSYTTSDSIRAIFKSGENFNINHELDYMFNYWNQAKFPSVIVLKKIIKM